MKKEQIENLKYIYENLKDYKKQIEALQNEYKDLETNEYVKRYLEIEQLLNQTRHYLYSKIENANEDELIRRSIRFAKPTNTTNIYYHYGTYKFANEVDIVHRPHDIRVDRNDKNAAYSLYISIEDDDDEKRVRIIDREDFEKENTIIFKDPMYSSNELYYRKLRNEYFKEVIENDEQSAKNKILKR